MQRRYEVYSLALVILLCFSIVGVTSNSVISYESNELNARHDSKTVLSTRTPHSPIAIISDENFTETALVEGWPGDGSSQNPFAIDGLDIDLDGAAGHCISISNTRVNFTIINCNLTGASVASGSGIYLFNATSARIINNNCSGNRNGIFLHTWSNYNAIINNTFNANTQGIHIWVSNYTTVQDNDLNGNGHGIFLEGAERNQLIRNRINDSAWSGIYLIAASFNAIVNNTCQNSDDYGIHIFSTHYVDVVNNTCKANTWVGIYCQESYALTITNNTCESNERGVDMGDMSADNIMRWNILESNTDFNAYDGTGGSNYISHNYWSDYVGSDANGDGIGDTPHVFPDSEDPFPLMYYPTPPRWVSKPHDVTQEHSYDLFHAYYEAIAPAPLKWWISDGVHFNLSNDGHLSSKYVLETITYDLRIVVSNIYGISISVDFTIRVIEHLPPSWMFAPYAQTLEYDEALDYYLAAIDSSGIAAWELNNTVQFALAEFYYESGSTARLTNATVLIPGNYALNISVFDTHGNKLSSILTVTVTPLVIDSIAPAWIIVSLSVEIEFGDPLAIQLGAWDASGIDHWWISDSEHFSIDEWGLVRNATHLLVSAYSFEARAYDPYGNYCSAFLTIIVVVPDQPIRPSIDAVSAFMVIGGMTVAIVTLIVLLLFRNRHEPK